MAIGIGILWASGLVTPEARAHGAVAERIDALDDAIASRPNDAALYDKRAELHALDENWTQASEDLEEALDLAPERVDLMHRLADAKLHLGDADAARRWTDAALARHPDEPRALLVRARARDELGEWRAAAADLSRLIALGDPPSPDSYRERAAILERGGDRDAAVTGLREGIARLGPLVTLIEPAVELEMQRDDVDAALGLIDRLGESVATTPRWQSRRGELLERAGRRDRAEAAYRSALAQLDTLPASRRDAPRQVALRATLRTRLEQVSARAKTDPPAPTPWRTWPALLAVLAGALLGYRLRAGRRNRP